MKTLKQILLNEIAGDSNIIIDLINNNRIATIYYKGDKENAPGWRTILPVAFGSHSSAQGDHDYIRAWQWKGKSVRGIPKWKLFRVDRMKNWNLSSTTTIHNVPQSNYNALGDKWMDDLYAHATFSGDSGDKEQEKPKTPNKPKTPTTPKKPATSAAPPPESTAPKPTTPKPQSGLEKPDSGLEKRKPKIKKKPGSGENPLREALRKLIKDILNS